jgi:2OG-Fe(II) oxygenase superfamily
MRAVSAATTEEYDAKGYCIVDRFLAPEECGRLLALIGRYREVHSVVEIHRETRRRSLKYGVIDGHNIKNNLPYIFKLYNDVEAILHEVSGQRLAPLADERVGVNVNITWVGGEYRWHYDRNACTAIIYLNEVAGGETELYPNYRLRLPFARDSRLQRWLDGLLQLGPVLALLGKPITVRPRAGTMLVMQGNRCLHSVRQVEGDTERIVIVLSYDVPGATFAIAEKLDAYLYTQEEVASPDPNYSR